MSRRASSTPLPTVALALLASSVAAPSPAAPAAGGPGPASRAAGPGPEVSEEDREWALCRVRLTLLRTGEAGATPVLERERLLFLGESIDVERRLTLQSGRRSAVVDVRFRLRAAAASNPGVMYFLTTEGVLAGSVGYEPVPTSKRQSRRRVLHVDDELTRAHEVYVAPELGERLILAVTVHPVFGREPSDVLASLEPPSGDLMRFEVETLSRDASETRVVQTTRLAAGVGRPATWSIVLASPGAEEADEDEQVDPERRLGRGVRVSDIGRHPDSGFGDDHVLVLETVENDFLRRNSRPADQSFLPEHVVTMDEEDHPETYTVRRKTKKISKKKREKFRRAAEIEGARKIALERSKTLPGAEKEEAAPQRRSEELHVRLEPLHATSDHVQFELGLDGNVRLPGDAEPTRFDVSVVEYLGVGESLEVGLAELARGTGPERDVLLRITPLP